MDLDRRSAVVMAVMSALMLAACSDDSRSSVLASPPPLVVTATTSPPVVGQTPSPSPSQAAPTPSPMTASWFPWLPPIDTTVDAVYQVDDFVAARGQVVPVSETPGGPPFRFDTGGPDPSTHPLMGFGEGGLLVVLHGPVVVDDMQWYLLAPAQIAIDVPTGWSPVSTPEGEPYLEVREGVCPAEPITTGLLSTLMLTDGLPACFGNAEMIITGELGCDAEADTFVTGAAWLNGGMCRFETPPSVYGLDSNIAPNKYAVTGHFLDEQAKECRATDGDASPAGLLVAILHCRRAFVATSVEPVD